MRDVYIQHKSSGTYAYPAPPDRHNDHPSVRGRVLLRSAPYAWRYDAALKRITTGDKDGFGVWDTYNDVPPEQAIRLYKRVTDSARQRFDLSNHNGIGGVSCNVNKQAVTAVPNNGAAWIIQDAPKPLPRKAGWFGASIVNPASGELIEMTSTATPDGLFTHPVYLSQHAKLSPKQGKAQPVMLVHANDWKELKKPKTTHDGAFGSDYAEVGSVAGLEGSWFAVWKFPWDLNLVPGFTRISFPVPVGKYPLLPDEWSGYKFGDENAEFRIGDDAEKFRTDVTINESVHHLESQNGAKLAMFGSRGFIKDLWNVTKTEQKRVRSVIDELGKVGVCAFSCWGHHHGLVFYRDNVNKSCITPARMAQLLQDPRAGVLQILNKHSVVGSLDSWANNYIRVYSKAK